MNPVLKIYLLALCSILHFASQVNAKEPVLDQPFELKQNEKIVLLGGGFIEREQEFCILEAMLVSHNPQLNVTVRNLGWSGDTVWAESRGLFDAPEKGYARMLDHLKRLKPTLIFLAYGANESQEREAGLTKFLVQYKKLLADLAPMNARLVLVSPVLQEKFPAPFPNPKTGNERILQYSNAIKQLAHESKIPFIDQSKVVPILVDSDIKLTTDSIRLTEDSYKKAAQAWAKGLGWSESNIYQQSIWPKLQEKLAAKNQLYFYRWRPQNITYLTLFRKHEQGKNAKETLMFDPLVEKAEAEIFDLLKSIRETSK